MCSDLLLFACTGAALASTSSEGSTGDRVGDGAEHELPYEKWGKCLQVLNLNNNKLQWLPDYIGSLHSLTKLDLSKYDVWAAVPVEVPWFMLLTSDTHTHAHTHHSLQDVQYTSSITVSVQVFSHVFIVLP